ncbi:MAG TPA: ureidoglycolate lyase [Acidimicrobiia bacterium]|nr:ureidoglycolate lyase [Acidimicrobiia bacterium]
MHILPLTAAAVTPEGFAPFGVLPPDEGDGNPTADLEFTRADGWVNYIGHSLDEIEVVDGRYRCELLNRHDTHTQTLMPMSGPAVVVVAPAALDFSDAAHLSEIRAFLLPQYACVHLLRGTWHWGPYPIGATTLRIFNIQGAGYPTDNGIAALKTDLATVVDVEIQV